jgi:hypothetical protein
VTVTTRSTAALPANALQRLTFGAAENARVEIPGAAAGAPGGPAVAAGAPAGTPGQFALALPAGTQSTTFLVQRQQPGPFRVTYTVVDACNDASPFTTFVGGGSSVR